MGSNAADGPTACHGTFVHVCLETAPNTAVTISADSRIDTDSPLCASVTNDRTKYCVIAATNITVAAPLHASGSRPLVLIATDSIVTTALIDVGSHSLQVGAGADPGVCPAGTLPSGGGGYAGGSFFGLGGSGGAGSDGSTGGNPAPTVANVSELRGGCPGQNNGYSNVGGHGGGAVFLIAGKRIDIRGGINAAGGGALGSSGGGYGGYGAGAGGMIGFEAPLITCDSLLLASGGGGGGGSANVIEGLDGEAPMSTAAARGGVGARGGYGGDGSAASVGARGMAGTPANGGTGTAGGGGGGGGAGLIKAPLTADLGTMVSPPPTP
jgi:hypothetical protein